MVLSGNVLNRLRRTVVVVPLSSSSQSSAPSLLPVRCASQEGVAVTDQVRAVSGQRLDRRMGELSAEDLKAVEQGVREVLEL